MKSFNGSPVLLRDISRSGASAAMVVLLDAIITGSFRTVLRLLSKQDLISDSTH